jgi:hypothetical protein
MKRDLKSELAVVHLLDPQSINDTDTASLILDTAGFGGALISVAMGALTGADADSTFLPVLQESDAIVGTGFTAVDAADVHGAFTLVNANTKDQTTQTVGYKGSKRYIRVNLDFTTGTGGISAALVGVVGVLGKPNFFPAVGPAAISAT